MDTKKFQTYSTKALQQMAKVRDGEELMAIQSVLRKRGALEDPVGTTNNPYSAEPEEEAPAEIQETEGRDGEGPAQENIEKAYAEPKKRGRAKSGPTRTREGAEALKAEADRNRGRAIEFLHGGQTRKGIIAGAVLDKRYNFVMYRIEVPEGKPIMKSPKDKSIVLGEIVDMKKAKRMTEKEFEENLM